MSVVMGPLHIENDSNLGVRHWSKQGLIPIVTENDVRRTI